MEYDAINYTNLGTLCELSAGHPLRASAESLESGETPIVQLKNVGFENGIDWSAVTHVKLPSGREPRWLLNDDVLFSARGGKNYAYPVIDPPKKSVCAPQFYIVRVREKEKLHAAFLAWQLNQSPAQNYIRRMSEGSNIQSIRREEIEKLPLALPPLKNQREIAGFATVTAREQLILQRLIENRRLQSNAIAINLFQQSQSLKNRGNAQ